MTEMSRVALRYPSEAAPAEAIVPDFHSVRQAINVASADQRLLVLVHAPAEQITRLKSDLRAVANDDRIIGRFHFDFDSNDSWRDSITGVPAGDGILIVRPGEFGLNGQLMRRLDCESSTEAVIAALTQANRKFAATTSKKVYSRHVKKGTSLGIHFKGAVPYGEDRDGDGEIDHRGRPQDRPQRKREKRKQLPISR